ncbi:DUF6311 domain-containing protein [Noviherbaspirillum saxi]|uniref:4-amino-4-deoxy-L-arabinose transferase n=1 Tax=Noviherbaspirillum saxi TaxID=2320863 RepID=A0A3A3GEM8_9BURK|nr:DUF6311 domain-containing protein [Noviherbaspirillum saxi]RJF99359.1 hypothetical protein D3871_13130 [Noviherbaspirillum saxi]
MKRFSQGAAFEAAPFHAEREGRTTDWFDTALAVLVGIAAFLLSTGGRLLRPKYIDWLWQQDPATFFLGWHFFRSTPLLQWPLGANPAYGAEIGSSVVFSDSIPLLALLFKPFAALLPATFQYIGLWLLLCFVLQAVFAGRLLARFTEDRWLRVVGCAFFAVAPVFLWRLYGHYALCGQWILIAGLCLYFSRSFSFTRWLLLLSAAALVHAYLLLLAGAIWAADLLQKLVRKEIGMVRAVLSLAAGGAGVLLVMWAAGYFMIEGEGLKGSATVLYRMNLLSVFDPEEIWSRLAPNLPQTDGDYEGFAFPGLGMLLLTPVALVLYLRGSHRNRTSYQWFPLLLIAVALLVYAVSNQVALGGTEWFSYALPAPLAGIAATFRATGRMAWLAYYLLYLGVLVAIFTRLPKRPALLLSLGLLCVQLADTNDAFRFFRDKFGHAPARAAELQSPIWNEFARKYRHVVYVLPYNAPKGYVQLAYFVGSNGMTINVGYFARVSEARQTQARQQVEQAVRTGKLSADTLYVFENDELWEVAQRQRDSVDYAATTDGYRVLAPRFLNEKTQ